MKNRPLFLFLVTFFTLFGAGKAHYWSFLTTDRSGWTYSVDLYSVQCPSPQIVRCKVLATHPAGGRVMERWSLDAERRLLVRGRKGAAETILPGSVADRAILFFRENDHLPPPNSPAIGPSSSGKGPS